MKTQTLFLYSLCFIFFVLLSNCKDDDIATDDENYELRCCKIPPVVGCIGGTKVYIPNAFTPNGDGVNDYFSPWSDGTIQSINSFVIRSFNSSVVFNSSTSGTWEGDIDGDEPVEGIYFYTISLTNDAGESATFEGSVCLRVNVPFACVEYEKQCAYPEQRDCEGGFYFSFPSKEADCQ